MRVHVRTVDTGIYEERTAGGLTRYRVRVRALGRDVSAYSETLDEAVQARNNILRDLGVWEQYRDIVRLK